MKRHTKNLQSAKYYYKNHFVNLHKTILTNIDNLIFIYIYLSLHEMLYIRVNSQTFT